MNERVRMTLDEIRLFDRVCRELENSEGCSLREIDRRLGVPVPRISALLKKIDTLTNGPATVERRAKKGINFLSREGGRLHRIAAAILKAYERLHSPREIVTVKVKTTNAILVNLLPGAITSFLTKGGGQVRLQVTEGDHEDILRDLGRGRIDFGIGPELPGQQWQARLEPLAFEVPLVAVAHPAHPLARQILAEGRDKVSVAELNNQLVYVLRRGLQPNAFERIQSDPSKGGRKIRVETYAAILGLARTGIGVGVVPGFHWTLDEMRAQGRIVYAEMPEMPRITICAYLPVGEEVRPDARELLSTIKSHIEAFGKRPKWHAAPAVKLPKTLRAYRFAYHVSCDDLGFGVPEWRKGTIEFKQRDSKATDFLPNGSKVVYKFSWQLEGRLLSIDARSKEPPDRYVAVFNAVGEKETLVGIWTGTGSKNRPLSAPTVLSKRELTVDDLRRITDAAMLRFIQGAEVGFGAGAEGEARKAGR